MNSGYTPPPAPPPQMPYGYVPPYPDMPGARPRKNRTWIIATTIVGAIGLIVLFVAGILAAVFGAMKSSEPCQHAVQVATRDPRAVAALGAPVAAGWLLSGNINVSGPSGNADLAIPVSGSHRNGTIYVVARKSAGRWKYQTLELTVDGQEERIDLLSANPQPLER